MSTATAAEVSVRPVVFDREIDSRVMSGLIQTCGAALLSGWSDDEPWNVLLPWPEEVRVLEWSCLEDWRDVLNSLEPPVCAEDVFPAAPFIGGWVGFLSYELGAAEEGATLPDALPPEPPLMFARHRSGLLRSDRGMWVFAPADTIDDVELRFRELLRSPMSSSHSRHPMTITDSLPGQAYRDCVETIRRAIARGDVYQTNLTRRLESGAVDPVDLHHALTEPHPPRCSAMIRGDGWTIASASPEVFLKFDRGKGVAESRPIKGTVRRGGDDREAIASLCSSGKDAAEHLMIVDLVRNDLGKVSPPGRVTVPFYRTVRTLRYVHHLESTVRAEGLENVSLGDLVAAIFPAGSITGAPKRAAVQMIRKLEPVARGVYCGAIGFVDIRGRTELSVAIRTAIVTSESARYHAGGGIVWESDPAAEDDESIAKSAAFLRYVEGRSE